MSDFRLVEENKKKLIQLKVFKENNSLGGFAETKKSLSLSMKDSKNSSFNNYYLFEFVVIVSTVCSI